MATQKFQNITKTLLTTQGLHKLKLLDFQIRLNTTHGRSWNQIDQVFNLRVSLTDWSPFRWRGKLWSRRKRVKTISPSCFCLSSHLNTVTHLIFKDDLPNLLMLYLLNQLTKRDHNDLSFCYVCYISYFSKCSNRKSSQNHLKLCLRRLNPRQNSPLWAIPWGDGRGGDTSNVVPVSCESWPF